VRIGSAIENTHVFVRRGRKQMTLCFAAAGLCGTALSGSAVANPPLGGGKSLLSTIDSLRFAPAASSRTAVRPENTSAPVLDLRPPRDYLPAVSLGPIAVSSHSADDAEYPARSGFGTGEARIPMMTQPETWLHRVHREGVPIVKLWNSKSALLSIGLNQKGKPGLWLTQKVH